MLNVQNLFATKFQLRTIPDVSNLEKMYQSPSMFVNKIIIKSLIISPTIETSKNFKKSVLYFLDLFSKVQILLKMKLFITASRKDNVVAMSSGIFANSTKTYKVPRSIIVPVVPTIQYLKNLLCLSKTFNIIL